jgi:hypothetical protein
MALSSVRAPTSFSTVGLAGVIGGLDGDRLSALRDGAHGLHDGIEVVVAELLELVELLDHRVFSALRCP